MTPLQADYHLFVLMLFIPLSSGITGLLMQVAEIAPVYFLDGGGSKETIEVAMMTKLPVGQRATAAIQEVMVQS